MKQHYYILSLLLLLLLLPESANTQANQPAQAASINSDTSSETELIDFNSIKDVLKKDMLDKEVNNKQQSDVDAKLKQEQALKTQYDIPKEKDFWPMFSEYWLIKNAPILKWDFEHPDYGIEVTYKELLEQLGYFEKKFRILIVNSPSIFHMALPSSESDGIYLVSLPFIRSLDLSKLEISLLLLEDFLRLNARYFIEQVKFKELDAMLGTNFYQAKVDPTVMKKLIQEYDKVAFDKGFSFQQQFETTKQMNDLLKAHPALWTTYYTMIRKIDDLVKGNILYQNYNKIFPSPELQINWLKPAGTKL